MNRPDHRFELEPAKVKFISTVSHCLGRLTQVRSTTFVGSFVERQGFAEISDIDVVVVVDALSARVFDECRSAVAGLNTSECGLPARAIRINDTFGPLKFDEPDVAVIHLMVYDVFGHRRHVLQSPFTCLDWERSSAHSGPSLREIYPVLALQPRQLLEARRGLGDYLDDLAACAIRFRRYAVEGEALVEVADRKPLDPRHQGEFAYHIVRNLVGNYAKVVTRTNARLETPDLLAFWEKALPASALFCSWFREIEALKRARAASYPVDTLARTREFLLCATEELEEIWRRRAVRHTFVRHARTALNDGRFLGQGRDPAIAETPAAFGRTFAHVFASPAQRTQQTAAALTLGCTPVIDTRLHEINYGRAEGMSFDELATAYPKLSEAWKRGEDTAFPDGENSAAVLARLESFLAELPPEPALVVTHNVVLRSLLGSHLGVPMAKWHLIPISHNEPIEVLRLDGSTYLDLPTTQMAEITDAVCGFNK